MLAYDRGDFDTARASYQQSLAIHQEQAIQRHRPSAGEPRQCRLPTGRLWHSSVSDTKKDWTLYRGLGQISGIASALGSLGNIEDAEGNYAAARSLQEESLALSRSLGDTRMTAYTLHNLGNLAVREGESRACPGSV